MLKRVGSCVYAHKDNWRELVAYIKKATGNDDLIRNFGNACLTADECYRYEIIKFDKNKMTFSFIESENWYTANEPIVGDSHVYNINTKEWKDVPGRKNNKQIYHHKWMFVADNYNPEWIAKSKERSEEWSKIDNIDKKKIGNLDYWTELLNKNGIAL